MTDDTSVLEIVRNDPILRIIRKALEKEECTLEVTEKRHVKDDAYWRIYGRVAALNDLSKAVLKYHFDQAEREK